MSKKLFSQLLPNKHFSVFYSYETKQSLKDLQLKNRKIQKAGYALLVIPVSAFMLGVWQVRRRKWKINLIKEMEDKVSQAPVPLPSDYSDLTSLEYRKVKVKGQFDHDKETYILPRMNIHSLEKNAPSQGGGAYVVTPFVLDDTKDVILVNRGWVPKNRIDPTTRTHGQVNGVVDLIGVVRSDEKRPQYSSTNDTTRNFWHVRDIGAIARQLGTMPVFIDADYTSTVDGGPIGGQTKVTLRNDHLQYIFTWFTLSAATFFMWFKNYLKK